MINIISIVVIGIVGSIFAVFLNKSEFAMGVAIVTGMVVLAGVIPGIAKFVQMVTQFSEMAGIHDGYLALMLKAAGISILISTGVSICNDAGQTNIATKIELAGRIALVILAMPALQKLVEVVMTTLGAI